MADEQLEDKSSQLGKLWVKLQPGDKNTQQGKKNNRQMNLLTEEGETSPVCKASQKKFWILRDSNTQDCTETKYNLWMLPDKNISRGRWSKS